MSFQAENKRKLLLLLKTIRLPLFYVMALDCPNLRDLILLLWCKHKTSLYFIHLIDMAEILNQIKHNIKEYIHKESF